MLSDERLIEIFKAMADPHRMGLFKILLTSDRSNSELIEATGLSQNLLSHHLNVLCACGLVRWQQSIGDARRRYFSPNLGLLADIGVWWRRQIPLANHTLPSLRKPCRVLFLCYRNASRSLMAETLARHLAPGSLVPTSAGLEPLDQVPPLLHDVLAEKGVSAAYLHPQTYHDLLDQHFDYVITVCDRAHEQLPSGVFAGAVFLHWSLHDPLEQGCTDRAACMEGMRELFQDLEQRIGVLVRQFAAEQ